MKKVYWRIRQILLDNKVFFETLMATVLSVAAIFVSCSANSIMKDQERIERLAESPSINLSFEYDNDGIIEIIKLNRIGGKIDNVQVRIAPLISYTILDKTPSCEFTDYKICYYSDISGVVYNGSNLYDGKMYNTREGTLYQIERNYVVYKYLKSVGHCIEKVEQSREDEDTTSYLLNVIVRLILQVKYTGMMDDDMEEYCETFVITPGIRYQYEEGVDNISLSTNNQLAINCKRIDEHTDPDLMSRFNEYQSEYSYVEHTDQYRKFIILSSTNDLQEAKKVFDIIMYGRSSAILNSETPFSRFNSVPENSHIE